MNTETLQKNFLAHESNNVRKKINLNIVMEKLP